LKNSTVNLKTRSKFKDLPYKNAEITSSRVTKIKKCEPETLEAEIIPSPPAEPENTSEVIEETPSPVEREPVNEFPVGIYETNIEENVDNSAEERALDIAKNFTDFNYYNARFSEIYDNNEPTNVRFFFTGNVSSGDFVINFRDGKLKVITISNGLETYAPSTMAPKFELPDGTKYDYADTFEVEVLNGYFIEMSLENFEGIGWGMECFSRKYIVLLEENYQPALNGTTYFGPVC
jgi:hypothetical protein